MLTIPATTTYHKPLNVLLHQSRLDGHYWMTHLKDRNFQADPQGIRDWADSGRGKPWMDDAMERVHCMPKMGGSTSQERNLVELCGPTPPPKPPEDPLDRNIRCAIVGRNFRLR